MVIKPINILICISFQLIALFSASHSVAKTPAFEIIENQATAYYYDPASGLGNMVLSNTATIQVAAVHYFTLVDDQTIKAAPGQFIYFSHHLTNEGNVSDTYTVTLTNLQDDDFDLILPSIYVDSNINGQLDAGESKLNNDTIFLELGESAHLVITGSIPDNSLQDFSARLALKAISKANQNVFKKNTDTVIVDLGVLLKITMNNSPICIELLEPESIISYRVDITNAGYKDPNERTFRVMTQNGIAEMKGVLLENTIPSNTIFYKSQELNFSPVFAQPVVMLAHNIDLFWTDWNTWNGSDEVYKLGLIIPLDNIRQGNSCHLTFDVKVVENATTGTMIYNTAMVDLNADGAPEFESNETCNKIFGEPADIHFIDSKYNKTQSFQLETSPKYIPERDNVYIELVSSNFNQNPLIAEDIIITVKSQATGDSIDVRVFETGNNTCIFRSKTPLILIENTGRKRNALRTCQEGEFCYFYSRKIDIITCEVVDPVEGRINDVASIEPFGYVFNSITLNPIEGVVVSLHKTDNTDVLDMYNTPVLPQTTNSFGRYQFSNVVPGEGYYIQVTPPDTYQFPSSKPAHMMKYKYSVVEGSYGRNGYVNEQDAGIFSLGLEKSALELDIPLDPIDASKTLVLEKDVDESIVFVGQTVSYSLTIHNQTSTILTNAQIVECIPDGFSYVENSLERNDQKDISPPAFDTIEIIPELPQSPNLMIHIGQMAIDETLVIRYQLIVNDHTTTGEHINYALAKGTYSGAIEVRSSVAQAFVIVAHGLLLEKTTIEELVNVDQSVKYHVTVNNISGLDLNDLNIQDTPSQGFRYVSGSSRIDNESIADPQIEKDSNGDTQQMIYSINQLLKAGQINLTYELTPTNRALEGNGINTAFSKAKLSDTQDIISNTAEAIVRVQTGPLILEKTTNTKTTSVGEWVPYNIRIKNTTGFLLTNVTVFDRLPYGFSYENQSARLSDQTLLLVQHISGQLQIYLPDLANNQEIELNYVLRVTPGAIDSDGINAAYVTGIDDRNDIKQSPVSRTQVDIQMDGIFSDHGIIFGKIFIDDNLNRIQDNDEWPVAGIKLFLEDGTWVITDENGQFSLYGISKGLHVLKMDPLTLPQYVQAMVTDFQQAGDPESRFVNVSEGEFHRADFILSCPCQHRKKVWEEIKARNDNIRGDWMLEKALVFKDNASEKQAPVPSDTIGDISSGLVYPELAEKRWHPTIDSEIKPISSTTAPAQSSEEKIKHYAEKMTYDIAKKGQFLWPENDISRDGKFIAVVRIGIDPHLKVNDQIISDEKLGEHAFNQKEKAQVLAWYGIQLQPGKNKVAVVGKDSFGNDRVLIEQIFYAPGSPQNLRIELVSKTLDADGGKSTLPITILLEDAHQKPANGIHFITLDIDDGSFVEPDIQPGEPGYQTRVENGRTTVHFRSIDRTGAVVMRAHMGQTLMDQAEIHLKSPKRPLIAVGLAEISLHMNSLSEKDIEPVNPVDDFDKELNVQNRVAVYLKGKIKGDILLTLAYDSEKNDNTRLFRDIDPDAYYPIYGDASIKGFDAQSTSRLYVKLEKGNHQAMWGDYVTDSQQDQLIRLGRFHRTLNGASATYETPQTKVSAFAARPYNNYFVEEIPANGTATFYQIQKERLPIKEYSETIEIITKDIDQQGLIIKTQQMKRFDEYFFDAFSGYISFHDAIASRDDNGNPVFIRIGYSSESETNDYNVAGFRLSQQFTEKLDVGGSFSMDDRPDDGTQILSGFVRLQPYKNQEIVAEVATQSHENEISQGMASRVVYNGQWNNGLETSISFVQADQEFTNPDSSIASGRQEIKGEMTYTPKQGTKIFTSVMESKGLNANDERISASLNVEQQFSTLKVTGGIRHTEQTNSADNDTINSLRLKLEKSYSAFDRPGKFYSEIEQDIGRSDRKSLKVGGEYFIRTKTKLYAEHELINSLDGISGLSSNVERSNTKFGISSQLLGATETYAEHRIRGGIDGRELESATGIRNSFEIVPNVSISPQMEYVHTDKGDDTNDAFSCSLGLNDKRSPNSRSSIRLDTRLGKQSDYYGFQGTHAARFSENWSGIIRENYAFENPETGQNKIQHRLTMGMALRPKRSNAYHLLGLFQWKEERHQNDVPTRQVFVFSTHHNYQLSKDMIFSGRLASKIQKMIIDPDTFRSNYHLLGFKLSYNLNYRWGMDIRSGMLTAFNGSDRYSFGLGVSYLIQKNFRLACGYQLTGFRDEDLDSQRYYAQGLRFGLQFKFDESLLNQLFIFE